VEDHVGCTDRRSDGWRDDVFPRKVRFTSTSLRLLQEVVATGVLRRVNRMTSAFDLDGATVCAPPSS